MEIINARPDILDIIKESAEMEGIIDYTITEVQTNQKGEGFLGEIFLVALKDRKNGTDLNIVIKSAFQEDSIRKLAPIQECFQNEVYFYSTIVPVLQKFEIEKGIKQITPLIPKCFKASLTNESEMVVMENLRSVGFECFGKRECLDDAHIRLIFKTYGRLHGYSVAYKNQYPEDYEKIFKTENIYEAFIDRGLFDSFNTMCDKVFEFLKPGIDDALIENFKKYTEGKAVKVMRESIEDPQPQYSVFLHGDCWSNNLMFKYQVRNFFLC